MTHQHISLFIRTLALGASALIMSAAIAQDAEPAAGEETAATETPEQIAARELCTETAAPGAYPEWRVKERLTCENSFAEKCRILRESDGVEAVHTCYEPLPMPEAPAEESGSTE